jgi:hypothetical protein
MLELLDTKTDNFVLDDFLGGLQGIDVRNVEGEFDEILTRL